MKKAMESCMHENHSGLLKPANPILSLLNQGADTLPFPVNNDSPFQTLPAQINNPFKNSNNPFKSSNVNLGAWNKLWNSRNKRQVEGLLQPTEEDFKEFLMDFEDFKGDVASKMGNLTCVLQKMDLLDSNLQINMKYYTGEGWNKTTLPRPWPERTQNGERCLRTATRIVMTLPDLSLSLPSTETQSPRSLEDTWSSSSVLR